MASAETEKIATELLRCAMSHAPESCLIGNLTALDLAALASAQFSSCPACGSEPWVNIDCQLCGACATFDPREG